MTHSAQDSAQVPPWSRLPRRHKNGYRVTMSPGETKAILILAADGMAHFECPDAPVCEACNTMRAVWWELCNALSRADRVQLQSAMRDCGIPLPDSPWEVIEPQRKPEGGAS